MKEWTIEEEAERYQLADKVINISWDERPVFEEMLGKERVITANKAINFVNIGPGSISGRCLFVGTDIPSNLDGINWFTQDVWPRVHGKNKRATLHICGTVCRKIDADADGVILCGVVEDLVNEYRQASVVVVPLRTGSGVKIKLTEAVGYMRCCVSTPCGIEGLPEKEKTGILISDDDKKFATHVNYLIENSDAREKCLGNTKAWASAYLNAETCYGEIIKYLQS